MLEKRIDMKKWEDKKKDRISALEYILDYVYNNTKDAKLTSILNDSIEKLKFERDSISQQN